MDPQLLSLIRLSAIVLLPVIPALLLFAALPSKAAVSGPLQGFKINLSGAFAAYFTLILIVTATHSVWDPAPNCEIWTVAGNVLEEDGTPARLLQTTDINVVPPYVNTNGAGGFQLLVATAVGPRGNLRYPSLTVSRNNFLPVAIELDPKGRNPAPEIPIKWDPKTQQIDIPGIKLRKLPDYAPTGAPPPAAPEGFQP